MKRVLVLTISVAVLLAILFLGWGMQHQLDTLKMAQINLRQNLAAIIESAGLCFLVYPITGIASKWLLAQFGARLPTRCAVAVLCASQFARYLPGNVGQHLARGVLLAREGVSTDAIAFSVFYETLLAFVIAGVFATLMLVSRPIVSASVPAVGIISLVVIVGLILIFVIPALWGRLRNFLDRPATTQISVQVSTKNVLRCSLLYAVNYILMGLGVYQIIGSIRSGGNFDLAFVTGAFSVAWIAGFVTPGVPAGIGVREAVLIAFLQPSMGVAQAIAVATLHRISSMLADVFAVVLGPLLLRASAKTEPKE